MRSTHVYMYEKGKGVRISKKKSDVVGLFYKVRWKCWRDAGHGGDIIRNKNLAARGNKKGPPVWTIRREEDGASTYIDLIELYIERKYKLRGGKERKKGKEKRKSFLIGVPHRERNLRGHEIVRYEEVVREVMVDDGTGNGASHILLAHHSRYRM